MYREFTMEMVCKILKSKNRILSQELIRRVEIDSRRVRPGDLFFALKGERTDGHLFARSAIDNGAIGVVVEKRMGIENEIIVYRTLNALGDLAQYYRSLFSLRIIGITGTNGKTTVKNLVMQILKKKFFTRGSEKNYNSLIGLPLSILKIKGDEEILVLEMGTSNPGEIRRLCEIAQPEIGLITNIGPGHIERFGSIEAINKEKCNLIESLPPGGFCVIGEGVEPENIKKDVEVLRFSLKDIEEVRLDEDGSYFVYKGNQFFTPLLGIGNVYNCLGAIVLTTRLGVAADIQKETISEMKPEPGRMEPIKREGFLIINDTYNANPLSMRQAIDFVAQLRRRKILVLGDMRELGNFSELYHKEIGEYARPRCDLLLTLGEDSKNYRGIHFDNYWELIKFLLKNLTGNEVILFKASRALEFERLVYKILKFL
uniref:UDP-N-acetylmuramoyl-tripeptide--D-alanyl-D-alanine ligase n=1 Tax=candidate division WOR-3 bacterium TaxID=2052148 RepID=A0A7C4TF26_UNCW3